jgi:D-methionine transport system substrate-binding protein
VKKLSSLCLLVLLSLTGCGSKEEVITVSATSVPHAEVLNDVVKDLVKKKGFKLVVVETDDYAIPNPAVANGSADANYFQHYPYLSLYNESVDESKKVVAVADVHIEPIGIYSKRYTSISQVKDGDTVIVSSSTADHGRLLNVLQGAGIITLKDGAGLNATIEDIQTYHKAINIRKDVAPELLVAAYNSDEAALVLINSNFALAANINPVTSALYLESSINNPYVNVLAVKKGNEQTPKTLALVEAIKSPEVKAYLLENYAGSVIAAF